MEERRAVRDLLREHRALRRQAKGFENIPAGSLEPAAAPGAEAKAGHDTPPRLSRAHEGATPSPEHQQRLELLKSENAELLARCQELIKENNNLFKLYIASHHLHSSLLLREVIEIISEIIVDLVGVSDFVLFLHDERTGLLMPVRFRGFGGKAPGKVRVGEGPVGSLVEGEQGYYATAPPVDGSFSPDRPLVVIPLKSGEQLTGVIAIYRLLSHKPAFTDVDYALFDFFAAHAATAIHSARLYAEAERKVHKMKEFLNLMKSPGQAEGAE
jgi:hypothetical protein